LLLAAVGHKGLNIRLELAGGGKTAELLLKAIPLFFQFGDVLNRRPKLGQSCLGLDDLTLLLFQALLLLLKPVDLHLHRLKLIPLSLVVSLLDFDLLLLGHQGL
jgi:hypothetical protein